MCGIYLLLYLLLHPSNTYFRNFFITYVFMPVRFIFSNKTNLEELLAQNVLSTVHTNWVVITQHWRGQSWNCSAYSTEIIQNLTAKFAASNAWLGYLCLLIDNSICTHMRMRGRFSEDRLFHFANCSFSVMLINVRTCKTQFCYFNV
jgi:hypothetical protein